MPDSEANHDPRCFARADLDEAVGRLVTIIRRERPQVIVTYPDRQDGYPHPDHLRVYDISALAFDAAGDPDRYPDSADPWQPLKMYFTVWSRDRILAIHEKLLEMGLESPFDEKWFERLPQEDRTTTRVEIGSYYSRRKEALLAHATQIDPASPFWFALPDDVAGAIHPWDDYQLARSLVDSELPTGSGALASGEYEDDLFAGIREPAYDPGSWPSS